MSALHRAEQSKCSRSLLLATILASTLLDAPTPPELIDKAQKNVAVQRMAERTKIRLLRSVPEGELSQFLYGPATYDRFRDKLLPIAALLTRRTVGDHHAMPVPKPLWGVYYLTRQFRLAAKAIYFILRRYHVS
jgi:hypothetical protein